MIGRKVVFHPWRSLAWGWVRRWVRKSFPTVEAISTATLAMRLSEDSPPLLLDVRKAEEYAVSCLPGAIHAPNLAAVSAIATPDTPLVLYCSVGYRSARLAELLLLQGYRNVVNLEGSIFQWRNEGRSLETQGQSTRQVHPYNRLWGLLIEPRA